MFNDNFQPTFIYLSFFLISYHFLMRVLRGLQKCNIDLPSDLSKKLLGDICYFPVVVFSVIRLIY